MSTAALTSRGQLPADAAQGRSYFKLAKKLFDSMVLGKSTIDLDERDRRDQEDGVERVTDANWQHTVASGAESDVWVIVMCVWSPPQLLGMGCYPQR